MSPPWLATNGLNFEPLIKWEPVAQGHAEFIAVKKDIKGTIESQSLKTMNPHLKSCSLLTHDLWDHACLLVVHSQGR